MASITRGENGRRTIQFVGLDGKRRSIRVGKMPARDAEAIKVKIEHLLAAKVSGCGWSNETARWVADLSDDLADKIARCGLIPGREKAVMAAFLDKYIEGRTDLKPRTRMKLKTTRDDLVEFFGPERQLRDVTPGDADDWRLKLLNAGLAENTVRKHAQVAKQFFNAAVRKRLLTSNPFADLRATVQPNPSRFYFVTRDDAQKVIDACPNTEWQLIFALSRYGGLRCPSEHLGLLWEHIDWAENRIIIHSPKTEHHAGKASRVIPLFPELRPYLEDEFELAQPGAEHVITRYRSTNSNLRTQLQRIIERAGLQPWPKLFQNLRSTRQTELEETFPSHVVCAWMGNSRPVAAKHYLQVTDAHFERAVTGDGRVLQNAVQYAHVSRSKQRQVRRKALKNSKGYKSLRQCTTAQIAEEGLEPPTRGL